MRSLGRKRLEVGRPKREKENRNEMLDMRSVGRKRLEAGRPKPEEQKDSLRAISR